MAIAFYSCRKSYPRYRPLVDAYLDEIVDSGSLSNGPVVSRLEKAIRAYTGAKHAIGVSNGTDALVLMLQGAGIQADDEILVPSFTFVASATSIVHAGATPKFVDIDPITYSIAVAQIEAHVGPRTRAIMPVHLFSQMADTKAIRTIAERHGLLILEDSAEGIGMWSNGQHAGLVGAAGTLSFFPTKTLGAFGDAGMILTNDDEIANRCLRLRDHGRSIANGPSELAGQNARMDEIQAAVLLARLPFLQQEIDRRAEIAAYYDRRLQSLAPQVQTPIIADWGYPSTPVFYVYVLRVERRDDLVHFLETRGIETEIYYPRPIHLQPCFAYLGHKNGDFPNSEDACRSTVALPLYPDLTLDEADMVCRAIETFYGKG